MKTHRATDPGRTDPMTLEPTDEYAGVDIESRPGDASPRVVFSSVFLLSALGLGAFLLMYSSVHAGEVHRATEHATVGVRIPGIAFSEGIPTGESTTIPSATTTKTTTATPTATATPTPTATATPTPTATAVSLMDASPPSVETERARSLPVPSVLIAPPRASVTVRVEPNPVQNPYDTPPTATPPHPSIDAPSNTAKDPEAVKVPEPAKTADSNKAADTNPYEEPSTGR